jgi:hypothetical protein
MRNKAPSKIRPSVYINFEKGYTLAVKLEKLCHSYRLAYDIRQILTKRKTYFQYLMRFDILQTALNFMEILSS